MNQPMVSCIMPTANRQKYVPYAIKYFLTQDYPNAEIIIIDDGMDSVASLLPQDQRIRYFYTDPLGTIGVKRNFACSQAQGEIIMHWDDDDWHADDWISQQVKHLISSGADICGIEHVHFFSPVNDTLWTGTVMNRNNPYTDPWLNGATLAYWKSFWLAHPFKDKQTGEDTHFVATPGAKVFAHDYIDGFVAILHADNTTTKFFENPAHKRNSSD